MDLTRDHAWRLLTEYTASESLLKPMAADRDPFGLVQRLRIEQADVKPDEI